MPIQWPERYSLIDADLKNLKPSPHFCENPDSLCQDGVSAWLASISYWNQVVGPLTSQTTLNNILYQPELFLDNSTIPDIQKDYTDACKQLGILPQPTSPPTFPPVTNPRQPTTPPPSHATPTPFPTHTPDPSLVSIIKTYPKVPGLFHLQTSHTNTCRVRETPCQGFYTWPAFQEAVYIYNANPNIHGNYFLAETSVLEKTRSLLAFFAVADKVTHHFKVCKEYLNSQKPSSGTSHTCPDVAEGKCGTATYSTYHSPQATCSIGKPVAKCTDAWGDTLPTEYCYYGRGAVSLHFPKAYSRVDDQLKGVLYKGKPISVCSNPDLICTDGVLAWLVSIAYCMSLCRTSTSFYECVLQQVAEIADADICRKTFYAYCLELGIPVPTSPTMAPTAAPVPTSPHRPNMDPVLVAIAKRFPTKVPSIFKLQDPGDNTCRVRDLPCQGFYTWDNFVKAVTYYNFDNQIGEYIKTISRCVGSPGSECRDTVSILCGFQRNDPWL